MWTGCSLCRGHSNSNRTDLHFLFGTGLKVVLKRLLCTLFRLHLLIGKRLKVGNLSLKVDTLLLASIWASHISL